MIHRYRYYDFILDARATAQLPFMIRVSPLMMSSDYRKKPVQKYQRKDTVQLFAATENLARNLQWSYVGDRLSHHTVQS